jgi:hypothetical protein
MADPTVFEYHVTPDQVPYSRPGSEVTVILQVTVTNRTERDVPCSMLMFTVTAGTAERDLVARLGLRCRATDESPWSVRDQGNGTFLAIPTYPVSGIPAGGSIGFVLEDVAVNGTPGGAVIGVSELTDQLRTRDLGVNKRVPGLAFTSLTAIPVEVAPGGTIVLSWTTTGATSCTLRTGDVTSPVDVNGTLPLKPLETTHFLITAEGGGTFIQQQITVTVATVRILDFQVSPTQVTQDADVTMRWLVKGADAVTIEPFHQAVDPGEGSRAFPIHDTGWYTLEASGYGRKVSQPRWVEVMPVVIDELAAVPQVVDPGRPATIQWRTTWASACLLEPPAGQSVDRSGSRPVEPAVSTTYTLVALGSKPQRREVTVAVGAAVVELGFTADPSRPGEVALTWQVACGTATLAVWGQGGTPSPRPVDPTGTTPVAIGATGVTYVRMVATGGGTTATANLLFAGPAVQGAAQLRAFRLRSGSGVNTPRSVVEVTWQAEGSSLRGEVRDASTRLPMGSLVGRLAVPLGGRVPQRSLWDGDVYVSGGAGGVGLAWDVA